MISNLTSLASKTNGHRYDSLVHELVNIFCERLRMNIPIIYTSMKDYHAKHPCSNWSLEHLYGIACCDCRCICVDLDDPRHNDLLVLVDTTAHELIHLYYDTAEHPPWFPKRVEQLIKGLRKFKKR